jgi:hypothetical protein
MQESYNRYTSLSLSSLLLIRLHKVSGIIFEMYMGMVGIRREIL